MPFMRHLLPEFLSPNGSFHSFLVSRFPFTDIYFSSIYYRDVELFKNQSVVDVVGSRPQRLPSTSNSYSRPQLVDDLAATLEVSRSSLFVVSPLISNI